LTPTASATHSDLPIPPREYLAEAIEARGLSPEELAPRMRFLHQAIEAIVKREEPITRGVARRLERVIEIAAHIWTGLESEYQLAKARQGGPGKRSNVSTRSC
jgi:HTH-type transcriptional regulator / antitoxin HigA